VSHVVVVAIINLEFALGRMMKCFDDPGHEGTPRTLTRRPFPSSLEPGAGRVHPNPMIASEGRLALISVKPVPIAPALDSSDIPIVPQNGVVKA
jgi:hypothetical protein